MQTVTRGYKVTVTLFLGIEGPGPVAPAVTHQPSDMGITKINHSLNE